ncbi:MAG: hypothetical protein H6Q67_491 [Firmicutes bacterium]|nr:hypothetical protein [Bacillota bacterium]
MQISPLFEEYQRRLRKITPTYIESYKKVLKEVQASAITYKGQPLDFLYQPIFLTSADMENFRNLIKTINGILAKIMKRYLEDSAFRAYFGFSPLLEKLILKDPGYSVDVPMARFDVFYSLKNGKFQFCELNTDGSSAMTEQQELARIFKTSYALESFSLKYAFADFELLESWVEIVKKNYEEYSKSQILPQVAIVDWLDGEPPSEFIEFQKAFERAGCRTILVDPRQLTYRGGKLYYNDFRIDCVYRRAVTWEVVERADYVRPFIDAYLAGDVCVIGPFRSQIVHNKILFALLHDPEKTGFLTNGERIFIKNHIPYTAVFDIRQADLVKQTIDYKDTLIIKPMDRYASKGVYPGQDYSREEWMHLLQEEAQAEYLVQEFCRVPKIPMAFFGEDEVDFISTNYLIGLFIYNGNLQGILTRAATKNIIGVDAQSYTLPNFLTIPRG